jgi:outer membrane protein assembly complex protein YaeT
MSGLLGLKSRRQRPWSFWVGAGVVSLITLVPAKGQMPGQQPASPSHLPTFFPTKEKPSLADAGTPATPTMLLSGTPNSTGLGLAANSNEPIVTKINFVGNRRWVTEALKNQIRTREGQPYNPEQVRNDVRTLDGTGRFIGGVRVEEYRTNEGIVLTFHVIERAIIEDVMFEGARSWHFSHDELLAAAGIRKGGPMAVAINRVAAQKIEQLYHTKGYYFCQVHLAEGAKPEDTRVVFQITEGPVVKVKRIDIVGPKFVSATRLPYGAKTETSDLLFGFFGSDYSPQELEQDIGKIIDYYRGFGFFDVKVSKMIKPTTDMKGVEITLVVDEGPRYLIKDVRVAGNRQLDNDILLAHNMLRPGQNYNEAEMKAGLRKMQDEYGQRGYVNTKVEPEFNYSSEPGTLTVVYKVDEGPTVAYAGEIKIVGNRVTRDDIIRKQLTFMPGQILDVTKIRESERNLARLQIFKMDPQSGSAPRIYLEDTDIPSPYKNVIVEVEEDRTGSFNIGAAIGSDAGVNANISLTERNFDILRFPTTWDDFLEGRAFRGGGQQFSIRAQPGTQYSNYGVTWTEPSLFNSDYSLTLAGYYNTRINIEDTEQRTGGRIAVGKRLSDQWIFSVGFRAEDIKITNVPIGAPIDYQMVQGDNNLFAPRISFVRDTRDSFLRATEGNRFEVGFEQAFGSFSFPSVTVEDSQYWTVYQRPDGSGRHVIMFHGIVGITGDDTPVYERYFAGGARNLRGFSFRGVGPDINGYKVGGDFEAIGTVEYQIPLESSDKLYAVAFCDFGTVESDVAFRDFRLSVGAGLRIMIPMLSPAPIALDFGFPIMKKSTDDRQVFSFTLGISY